MAGDRPQPQTVRWWELRGTRAARPPAPARRLDPELVAAIKAAAAEIDASLATARAAITRFSKATSHLKGRRLGSAVPARNPVEVLIVNADRKSVV